MVYITKLNSYLIGLKPFELSVSIYVILTIQWVSPRCLSSQQVVSEPMVVKSGV